MVKIIIPKLRFKEFKDNWKYYTFEEIISSKSNTYNPQKNMKDYKCIELEHINQEDGTINGYTSSKEQKSSKNFFSEGSILFGKLRPYLKKYWLASFSGVCSSEILVLNSKDIEIINNKFIFYLVQIHYFIELCKLSTGSKMPRADWSYIKEQSIAIPTVEEQEKISKMLSLLDKKIELQKQKIEALKLYKFGFIKQYFKNLKHYTEVAFEEIGKEYSTSPLGKDLIDENGKKPIIFYGDIFTIYEEIIDEIKNFTNYDIKNIELSEINDIILPSSTTVDALSLISASAVHIKGAIYGGDIILYRINNNIANSDYVSYQINYDLKHTLAKYAQGSTIIHIYFEHFKKIKLKLPIIKEQEKMVNLFNLLNKKINYENSKFKVFNYIKKSLLQQLFI